VSWARLAETCDREGGPFADHLESLLLGLTTVGLGEALRGAIRHGRIADRTAFYGLRGAGLVVEEGELIVPANLLYARFFRRVLKAPAA
jgi:hypothetical protein